VSILEREGFEIETIKF